MQPSPPRKINKPQIGGSDEAHIESHGSDDDAAAAAAWWRRQSRPSPQSQPGKAQKAWEARAGVPNAPGIFVPHLIVRRLSRPGYLPGGFERVAMSSFLLAGSSAALARARVMF